MKKLMLLLFFAFFTFLVIAQENIPIKDSIIAVSIKTGSMNKNKELVEHYEDFITILYSKSSNEYITSGYVKLLTKYIRQKRQKPIAYHAENGELIDKKHIYHLFNEIKKKDTVFNINNQNLELIQKSLNKKKIKSILKQDGLYKKFKKKSEEEKEKFYQLILGDNFKYYLNNRFSLKDEVIEYPKNFHVYILSVKNDSLKTTKLVGNTGSSTLQPWKYHTKKSKIKKKDKSKFGKLTIELIEKSINNTLLEDVSSYESSLNLNINFALENIIPYNFWNRDYVTTYGIVKDYILWSYGNFEREIQQKNQ